MGNQYFYIMLYGRFIQSRCLISRLKTLKSKTLASDCEIKKDVTTMPLPIYHDKLYMLHPLLSAFILKT